MNNYVLCLEYILGYQNKFEHAYFLSHCDFIRYVSSSQRLKKTQCVSGWPVIIGLNLTTVELLGWMWHWKETKEIHYDYCGKNFKRLRGTWASIYCIIFLFFREVIQKGYYGTF